MNIKIGNHFVIFSLTLGIISSLSINNNYGSYLGDFSFYQGVNLLDCMLHDGIRDNDSKAIQKAINLGARINGNNCIHNAVYENRKDALEVLISNGVDINELGVEIIFPDDYSIKGKKSLGYPIYLGKITPITIAALLGYRDLLKFLLLHGANPERTNELGDCGNFEQVIQKAIKKAIGGLGVEGNIMRAISSGHIEALKSFINTHNNPPKGSYKYLFSTAISNFDLNKKNKAGKTLLMVAVLARNEASVRALLKAGINTDITDNQQNTALLIARKHKQEKIATMIEHYSKFYKKLLFVKLVTLKGDLPLVEDIWWAIADYAFD